MKKQNLGTDKAIMTIEFVDLNKTTVTIPDEAIKSSTSLDSYLNNNTKGLHLGLQDNLFILFLYNQYCFVNNIKGGVIYVQK